MNKEWKVWLKYLSWFAIISGVLWVSILVAKHYEFSNSDSAAWFQAVFSVIAIAAAIWISNTQRRTEEARHKRGQIDAVIGIAVLIARAESVIQAFSKETHGSPSPDGYHSIEVIAGRLENTDIVQYSSPIILKTALSSANQIRRYLNYLRKGFRGDNLGIEISLQKSRLRLFKFYGLSDDDLPKSVSTESN
ncbi:hypothetical protein HX786_00995 [Pseudomonas sp. 21615526]|uniref:hypothetical protein n=1 Tax=Pseudomonas sp. 21615526 TaxID=2738811 RepID=UPI0015C1BA5C|nr:hypothetical protein [Pseudomonas sp. 21615526]NVZ36629.1 hypothetical protein [Pseudomonas sp. 21615526]